jgi:hypothetical protein
MIVYNEYISLITSNRRIPANAVTTAVNTVKQMNVNKNDEKNTRIILK